MLAGTMEFPTLNVLPFTENRLKPNKDRYYSRSGMQLALPVSSFAHLPCSRLWWDPALNCLLRQSVRFPSGILMANSLPATGLLIEPAHRGLAHLLFLQGEHSGLPNRQDFKYRAIQARPWRTFYRVAASLEIASFILCGKAFVLFSVVLCQTFAAPQKAVAWDLLWLYLWSQAHQDSPLLPLAPLQDPATELLSDLSPGLHSEAKLSLGQNFWHSIQT